MSVPALILGSASPRRVALLKQLGIDFTQCVNPDKELDLTDPDPRTHALRSARAKATAVYSLLKCESSMVVLGADTVVSINGISLGKPLDSDEATEMLQQLSGKRHEVYTGIVLHGAKNSEIADCVCTEVWMKSLSDSDIKSYISCREPFGKAGAYAIQGRGARFVERINGCYYNVVGLPLSRLSTMLQELGYNFSNH